MWQCSQQHTNREEAKFCAKCGEKRVLREPCAACGTILEPEDVFCTSCGQKRGEPSAPGPVVAPVPVVATVPAPPPVVVMPSPAPVVVPEPVSAAAPVPEPVAVEPPAAAPVPEEEPVTFSFGGALIEMKDDSSKPRSASTKQSADNASGGKSGMSSATTGLLSFVLFAAVLALALYFVSR